MKIIQLKALLLALAALPALSFQSPAAKGGEEINFGGAASSVQRQLTDALAELDAVRSQIETEQIPLSRELSRLEKELSAVRAEALDARRALDRRSVDVSGARRSIEQLEANNNYLDGLLSDYVRSFESSLHITELQRYGAAVEAANLARENSNLTQKEVFAAQTDLLSTSMDRLEAALGGDRFEGTAVVDVSRVVKQGTFIVLGPMAIFRSKDGIVVGTAEQRLGSLEPTVIAYANPADTEAATGVAISGLGRLPVDTTLGDAHKVADTEETFLEHVSKGGAVMVPIGLMAGLALLVALFKWIALSMQSVPSRKAIDGVLEAISERDEGMAKRRVGAMKGPVGRMLQVGVEHVREPRELIEEVMFENVLKTKLKLQSLLPFIAVSAASAPLLGLLGTVTGIIDTFKMITLFGAGDVKALSGGISEALITTKFGLIVAIPSLLLHAFLSRKARNITGKMEQAAVSFVNQVSKSPWGRNHFSKEELAQVPDADLVKAQVREALSDLLEPMVRQQLESARGQAAHEAPGAPRTVGG